MILSVLVCTMPERKQMFKELVSELMKQKARLKSLDEYLEMALKIKYDTIRDSIHTYYQSDRTKEKGVFNHLKNALTLIFNKHFKENDMFFFLGQVYDIGVGKFVEIISDDEVGINIGHKRNNLLKKAKGEFIVFIDDDDLIYPNYLEAIISKIIEKPDCDCVGINGIITTNGEDKRKWFISKDYGKWYEENKIYYRTPNHISPVRRIIAKEKGFPCLEHGEDYHYSMGILDKLQNEAIVNEPIYHYRYNTKK